MARMHCLMQQEWKLCCSIGVGWFQIEMPFFPCNGSEIVASISKMSMSGKALHHLGRFLPNFFLFCFGGYYGNRNGSKQIKDAKRLIGRKYSDPSVQNDMKLWPFKVYS